MTFSLAGLFGNSAPGRATELDRSTLSLTALANSNVLHQQKVPQIAPAATTPAPVETIAPAVQDEFETLAEAVAAQDHAAADEALQCLAGAIYFESKGEPLAGQLAVAEVIINRAKSGRFPADVCDVVTQRGQFGFVRAGRIPSINAGAAYRTAVAVAKVALADAWNSPAAKALYFNTPDRAPAARLIRIASIGNHVFYR